MNILDDVMLANLFGATEKTIAEFTDSILGLMNKQYEKILGKDRDALILDVLKKINADSLKNSGTHRETDWEDGWGENLAEFIESGHNMDALIPKYYKKNVPIRLNREYVMPAEPDFTYKYTVVFREWLFKQYFREFSQIYEFGCGTAHNLAHLAQLFPEKALFGFDWAKSSQRIIEEIATAKKLNISGKSFNFFDPDESIAIGENSAFLTFGALEQVGLNHGKYLGFVLRRKPRLCVDVIGAQELYDDTNLLDYLALAYHNKRNYLAGYITRLRELEKAGSIEILKIHRQMFGNLYDDPYSYVVWRCL